MSYGLPLHDPVTHRSEHFVDTASLCRSARGRGYWPRGVSLEYLRGVEGSPGHPVPVASSYKSTR
jgi:hypothetical protein